jgi:hypothetical protein
MLEQALKSNLSLEEENKVLRDQLDEVTWTKRQQEDRIAELKRQLTLVNCDNEQLEQKLHGLNVLMKQQDERRLVSECIDRSKSRRLQ